MDKNAIKKYAVWARRELIERVTQKAQQYGITAEGFGDENADSIKGKVLSDTEKKQRKALIQKIKAEGFEQVMEEVAYTWFNRFTALRFMEVNNYLPSHTRVFTNEANEFKPQILSDAISLELDGLDMEKVYELKEENKDEELYKYLLITQCNALSSILPGMFQKIADYTELLLPDYLLREGSIIEQMVTIIPEEDWTNQVQIIGWLYQYYNSEKKDEVFAALKKNVKVTKENIPAATQLFTPDWIVRYMVENSLGRIWIAGHPDDVLKRKWRYYIDDAEQEADVIRQFEKARHKYSKMSPENIKCIDPCSGSGHMLAYLFDVLVEIYEAYGFSDREAVASIVENNIYGLDIDSRAAQLAYFSIMMKARQYDRRFLHRGIQPHVFVVQESNGLDKFAIDYFCDGDVAITEAISTIIKEMHNAREYGSLVSVSNIDFECLYNRIKEIENDISIYKEIILNDFVPLIQCAEVLSQKYDVTITNPPYMGGSSMSDKLSSYVKDKYPGSKTDLFAVFIEKCKEMTKPNGLQAMITMQSWMFLQSFKNLRASLLTSSGIVNMLHLGMRAFEQGDVGTIVQTTCFVLNKNRLFRGRFIRTVDEYDGERKKEKVLYIAEGHYDDKSVYDAGTELFTKLPNSPIAYWANPIICDAFAKRSLSKVGEIKTGLQTGNNDLYLKLWYEVSKDRISFDSQSLDDYLHSGKKWVPQVKGGEFRRWYGNFDYVLDWENDGKAIRACKSSRLNAMLDARNGFREGISWSHTSDRFGVRFQPASIVFNVEAPSFFTKDKDELYVVLAFLNSKVARYCMDLMNSTVHFLAGDVKQLPFLRVDSKEKIVETVKECIAISKADWDSFETSWDFKKHPLVRKTALIEEAYLEWEKECQHRFDTLKKKEEELNKFFIEMYGLENELSPLVEDKDVSVCRAEIQRDIKSFVSYAVGCMLGRYSIDFEGLAYAGGDWNQEMYQRYIPDEDGIIPICDDEYFEDDIVGLFEKFVAVIYGKENLEKNLNFIAKSLGGKGNYKTVIREYFINSFFADHCAIYSLTGAGKRPIYWLFDSGKKNGFKCLVYAHRYKNDTIARIRTDYVHEQQSRYRTVVDDLEKNVSQYASSDKIKATKRLKLLKEQLEELRGYEEMIHHFADQMVSINLDDGIKSNYALLQDVLAKVK